jgi:hypothetical protein
VHLRRCAREGTPTLQGAFSPRDIFAAGRGEACQEAAMPAKSKAQQKAAGAALAAKRGEIKVSELKGASRQMYESMSEAQLEEFASTKLEGKPERVGR